MRVGFSSAVMAATCGYVISVAHAEPDVAIEDRPISFSQRRSTLTLEYRRAHVDPEAKGIDIAPRVIVVHHTGFARFERAWSYFNRELIESGRKRIAEAGRVNVSAHFLVDRDGRIVRLMPETRMARHCIGLNHVAIGIENVGGTKDTPLTDAQLRANADLVRHLVHRFPITHLIGHHEYRQMEQHPYFRERNRSYRTSKVDPGPRYMSALRERLRDLDLRGP